MQLKLSKYPLKYNQESLLNFSTISVIGLGYIGLPTACTFATHGKTVYGIDTNQQVIDTLRNGGLHIHEPGLRSLVQSALASGRLHLCETPQEADAFIIAVPTPFDEYKHADLRAVISACKAIIPVLHQGNLVVLESTSPPGTTYQIVKPILENSGLKCGEDFLLAYVPERVLPGQIIKELVENARVIGGYDHVSSQAGCDLYKTFVQGEIFITDATTAEMVKLMENTFRDVNIALANEFSRISCRFGVNVWEAISIANRHPRVNILNPGPGVGGHCIGVDPWFLVEAATDITPLIQSARHVNDTQPRFVVDLVNEATKHLTERKIGILGLSYKANVDDLRESPSLEVARLLITEGVQVFAYEPHQPFFNMEGMVNSSNLDALLQEANLILLLVPHATFKNIKPTEIMIKTNARIVIDATSTWNATDWKAAGFQFFRLGDGKNNP